ncbi:MAG: VWA domain-containing protein, partial [Bryobacteraceae bacterium]
MLRGRIGNEKGIAVLALAPMMVGILAVVGLAIDAGILYLVKSKLSAAVDAGALAGTRALARGMNSAEQELKAKQIAQSYVKLNFPQQYMFTSNLTVPTPTISLSTVSQRRLTLEASVQVPTLFLSTLGLTDSVVRASAIASRRDVNILLVLDRSGSMSGACSDLKQAAKGFVVKFAEGRDKLGMVSFATSSGVDYALADNFKTSSPDLATMIDGINCNGWTNTGQALAQGYSELVRIDEPNSL